MTSLFPLALRSVALILLASWATAAARGQEDAEQAQQIERLVQQLDDDDAARRDEAEKALVELGLKSANDGGEAFLRLLPKPNDRMPQEVQTRLARITGEVQTKAARQAVTETRVTLDLTEAPLADVLTQLEKQTGNKLTDHREQFGQQAAAKRITIKVEDEPFWSALDKILDVAGMSTYPYSGEDSLGLVEREPGAQQRAGRANYSGPFRIEATGVTTQRGLRAPDQSGLRVDLEIAWEPRLRPIALTQAAADLKAVCDDGSEVPPASEDAVFDIEIQPGSHAAEVTIPLQLPARSAKSLATVKGTMTALVPGRIVDMKFENLAKAADASQETGGVTVTIDRVAKNQALWEIHMRVAVEGLEAGLESHRGWVFQNVAILEDKAGETIDNAGFETTMQTEEEAGFAYFYELPEGTDIADCVWVYRTPAAIVSMPIEYELKDVPLP